MSGDIYDAFNRECNEKASSPVFIDDCMRSTTFKAYLLLLKSNWADGMLPSNIIENVFRDLCKMDILSESACKVDEFKVVY